MACILFAWELGVNLGHIARDLPLARACRQAGHQVVMAVPGRLGAATPLANEQFAVARAPFLRPSTRRRAPPVNYADMLLHEGFDDAIALAGVVERWRNVFRQYRIQLMVYNHAPSALLAARMAQLPVMLVGTGFEIPPAVLPLPSFRPWQAIPRQALIAAEAAVLAQVNPLLARSGQSALTRLPALFAGSNVQLTTFPELDSFGPRTGADYIGPVYALPSAPVIAWQASSRRRIFAYLRPTIPGCGHLLAALQAQQDTEILCAMPGVPGEWQTRYDRLRFVDHAVDLAMLLPRADLVVTYGAGTVATALLAGVPVLAVPQVIEQYLAGLPLEATGAGLMLWEQRTPELCLELITRLLQDTRYRQAAADFAQRHAGFSREQAVRRQQAALEAQLAGRAQH